MTHKYHAVRGMSPSGSSQHSRSLQEWRLRHRSPESVNEVSPLPLSPSEMRRTPPPRPDVRDWISSFSLPLSPSKSDSSHSLSFEAARPSTECLPSGWLGLDWNSFRLPSVSWFVPPHKRTCCRFVGSLQRNVFPRDPTAATSFCGSGLRTAHESPQLWGQLVSLPPESSKRG